MIVNFEQLPDLRSDLRDKSIALRAGCYDIIHEGHILGLQFAKSQADILVVGVHPDFRVTERKGPGRPIRPELSRLAVVDAIRYADYSLIMPSKDDKVGHSTLRVVDALRPDVFVAPQPPATEPPHPNDEMIEAMGTRIVFDPTYPPHSTTNIINSILSNHQENTSGHP